VEDPRRARDELLLPGLAVYASPENLEKHKDMTLPEENWTFSSSVVKEVIMNEFYRINISIRLRRLPFHSDITLLLPHCSASDNELAQ